MKFTKMMFHDTAAHCVVEADSAERILRIPHNLREDHELDKRVILPVA